MTNEELTKELDYFDSVVAIANSKVNGVDPNSPKWQTACAERYKTLLTLSSEVKDFLSATEKSKTCQMAKHYMVCSFPLPPPLQVGVAATMICMIGIRLMRKW